MTHTQIHVHIHMQIYTYTYCTHTHYTHILTYAHIHICTLIYTLHMQARSQGGLVDADEPPSEIKGSLFLRKAFYIL